MTTRRRGDVLNEAIFAATLDLLQERGYAAVTFQRVAQAARTSRSVLYRSWSSPFQLIVDAARWQATASHNGLTMADRVYDTGSLRGDLLAAAKDFIDTTSYYSTLMLSTMFYGLSQAEPDEIHTLYEQITASNLIMMGRIVEAATLRGEITHRVSDRAKLVFFEILRSHALLLREPFTETDLEEIIDQVVLPAILAVPRT
ncbi:MAG: TetR/AcrR family transcriptional regulator [Propionibacteriaceae bacterium]|jgi:AcrR family transcriptional regulator|nr:TetR/AcrR family transcriptional regulator [Propionibacteriaceae bacterium]